MKLYFRYFRLHLQTLLEYKTSFIILFFGQLLLSFSAFLSVYFMFNRFNSVNGYGIYDVFLCFSITQTSFSLAECFGRGFDQFNTLLSQGGFDRILVRPRNVMFQVLASTLEFTRFGRLLFAFITLILALFLNPIAWGFDKLVVLILMIFCGTLLYFCLFIMFASLCFFTTESLEFMNILTDGSREFGTYPYGIYGKHVLKFVTFIVPLALVQYYPLRYILGHDSMWYDALLPIVSLLFMIPSLMLWKIGRRYYRSTGS